MIEATQVPLSIHLTDHLPGHDRRRFELRFGDCIIWTDSVWSGMNDPMEEAIGTVARRLQDLMYNGAIINYDEDY